MNKRKNQSIYKIHNYELALKVLQERNLSGKEKITLLTSVGPHEDIVKMIISSHLTTKEVFNVLKICSAHKGTFILYTLVLTILDTYTFTDLDLFKLIEYDCSFTDFSGKATRKILTFFDWKNVAPDKAIQYLDIVKYTDILYLTFNKVLDSVKLEHRHFVELLRLLDNQTKHDLQKDTVVKIVGMIKWDTLTLDDLIEISAATIDKSSPVNDAIKKAIKTNK